MDEYVRNSRIERYNMNAKNAKIDLTRILKRNSDEADLDAYWGAGIKMDWTPVPIEQQKTHINWRQSPDDDGTGLERLASFPQNEKWLGASGSLASAGLSGSGSAGGLSSNVYVTNHKAMESSSVDSLKTAIAAGKAHVKNNSDSVKTEIKNKYEEMRKAVGDKQGLDHLALFCLADVKGTSDYSKLISEQTQISNTLGGITNPAVVITGMDMDIDCLKYAIDGQDPPSTDTSTSAASDTSASPTSDTSSSTSTKKTTKPAVPAVSSSSKNANADWVALMALYCKWAEYLGKNVDENKLAVFPKVCYLYVQLLPLMGISAEVIDKAFKLWEGKSMPNGAKGCVDAIVRIGGEYNSFLAQCKQKGIASTSGLLDAMKAANVPTVKYSESEAKAGDVVFYEGSGFQQDHVYQHVMIIDGRGGCVGNSSNQNAVVRRNPVDYWPEGFKAALLGKTSTHGLK